MLKYLVVCCFLLVIADGVLGGWVAPNAGWQGWQSGGGWQGWQGGAGWQPGWKSGGWSSAAWQPAVAWQSAAWRPAIATNIVKAPVAWAAPVGLGLKNLG